MADEKTTGGEKIFTQADLDAQIAQRLDRERAKFGDYEALKEKAAKYDEAEEKTKSELQKAREEAADYKAKYEAREKIIPYQELSGNYNALHVRPHLVDGFQREIASVSAVVIQRDHDGLVIFGGTQTHVLPTGEIVARRRGSLDGAGIFPAAPAVVGAHGGQIGVLKAERAIILVDGLLLHIAADLAGALDRRVLQSQVGRADLRLPAPARIDVGLHKGDGVAVRVAAVLEGCNRGQCGRRRGAP